MWIDIINTREKLVWKILHLVEKPNQTKKMRLFNILKRSRTEPKSYTRRLIMTMIQENRRTEDTSGNSIRILMYLVRVMESLTL